MAAERPGIDDGFAMDYTFYKHHHSAEPQQLNLNSSTSEKVYEMTFQLVSLQAANSKVSVGVLAHLHAVEQQHALRFEHRSVGGRSGLALRGANRISKPGRAGRHALLCVRPVQVERQPRGRLGPHSHLLKAIGVVLLRHFHHLAQDTKHCPDGRHGCAKSQQASSAWIVTDVCIHCRWNEEP